MSTWRENIERVLAGPGRLSSEQRAALDALTAQMEELEGALRQIMARCQHPGDYLSMELLHIEADARAALAQSDPPDSE